MAVLLSVDGGGTVTQRFGPPSATVASLEPAMWATKEKAYWVSFPGATYFPHFHPGEDRAAAYGTPVQAMEAGTVVYAAYKNSIDGYKVEVEIRPGTKYALNHLASVGVRVGQAVKRGQQLGKMGCTGSCTGPHNHEGISIFERGADGIQRTMNYDPALFQPGGRLEDDERITPLIRKVYVNDEPGINVWRGYPEFDDRSDIFAITKKQGQRSWDRPDGIYRRDGKRLSGLGYGFSLIHTLDTKHHGDFYIVTGYGKTLAIAKRHMHL